MILLLGCWLLAISLAAGASSWHTRICQFLTHKTVDFFDRLPTRIGIAVDNADAYRKVTHLKENLKNENNKLNKQILSSQSFGDIIYQSDAMRDVLQQVDTLALSDSTMLISGETSTGKEIIARAIHQMSLRRRINRW